MHGSITRFRFSCRTAQLHEAICRVVGSGVHPKRPLLTASQDISGVCPIKNFPSRPRLPRHFCWTHRTYRFSLDPLSRRDVPVDILHLAPTFCSV